MAESVLTQHEFKWEVSNEELDKWKAANEEESFESQEFPFYGETWSLECYPNRDDKKGVLSITLNRKSDVNDLSLDVYGFVLSIICNESCLAQEECEEKMKSNDTSLGPIEIDIGTLEGRDIIVIRFVFNAFGRRKLNEFEWIRSYSDFDDSDSKFSARELVFQLRCHR
eukprot:899941_1